MGFKVSIADSVVTFTSLRGVLRCDADQLAPDIREQLMLHGLKQKVGDAAALGAGSSDDKKLEAMRAVWEMLCEGEWSKRTPGTGSEESITVEAMARATGATLQQAREVFEGLDKKAQAAMRKSLAVEIAAIQAERAEKVKVGSDATDAAAKALAALRGVHSAG
jgi:hypothetical protein